MNAIHSDVRQIRAWLWAEIDERNRKATEAEHEAKIQALSQRYDVSEEWLRDPESNLFDILSDQNMPEETKRDAIPFEILALMRERRDAQQSQSSEPSPPATPVPPKIEEGEQGEKMK